MACPPAIRRLLVRPDNKEKVELFGPDEGLYGFRRWQHKRKAWRRASESNGFESYAGAVVEAAAQINWITRSLTEQNDWRLSYQLELLRGLTFHFDLHEAQRYGDYDHCSACSVQLAEHDWPAVQHEGYVTRYSIPNGSGGTHWKWICEQCFNDLYNGTLSRIPILKLIAIFYQLNLVFFQRHPKRPRALPLDRPLS